VDKRSASTFVAGGMVDALRLSTLRMSKIGGLSSLFGSGLSGLGETETKSPALGRAFCWSVNLSQDLRRMATKLISPNPRSAREAGSGMAAGELTLTTMAERATSKVLAS